MRNDVLSFTEDLSELLGSGLPLVKCLSSMKGEIAEEVRGRLSEGDRLSVALMTSGKAEFPGWYVAFVDSAEVGGGDLAKTFAHIASALRERKDAREKFIGSAVYPLVVAVLTAVCGIVSVLAFFPLVEGTASGADFGGNPLRDGALRSCVSGGIFLAAVCIVFVLVLRKMSRPDPFASVFSSLSFLTGSHVPIVQAIDCSLRLADDSPSLCVALMRTRGDLMAGIDVPSAFSSSLIENGFDSEARLALSALSLSGATGNDGAFAKIASAARRRREKIQSLVISLEQPVLLCAAAVYLLLVLKDTAIRAIFPEM